MKKIIALLLALTMLVLVGCQAKPAEAPASAQNSPVGMSRISARAVS